MDVSGWRGAVTLAIALLGAVLGIINTWQALRRDAVRLRVRPLSVVSLGTGALGYGIEVVNLSSFAVTIQEVGFTLDKRTARKGERAPVVEPILRDGAGWPRRLEPREVVTAYFNANSLGGLGPRIVRAYARTACDEYAYGYTPAIGGIKEIDGRT